MKQKKPTVETVGPNDCLPYEKLYLSLMDLVRQGLRDRCYIINYFN